MGKANNVPNHLGTVEHADRVYCVLLWPTVTHPTLYDLIWDEHVVDAERDGICLLYVDRHIVHEVDSPQAFDGLRRAGLRVRAPEKTLLTLCLLFLVHSGRANRHQPCDRDWQG